MSWDKVDWSQAPAGAVAWSAGHVSDGRFVGWWHVFEYREPMQRFDHYFEYAPSFGYTGVNGDASDSLTLRPKGEKE